MKNTLGAKAAEQITGNKVPEQLKNVTTEECEMARKEVIDFYAKAKQSYIDHVENGSKYKEPIVNRAYLSPYGVYAETYPKSADKDFVEWCSENELGFYFSNIDVNGVELVSIRVHPCWDLLTEECRVKEIVSNFKDRHERWPNGDGRYRLPRRLDGWYPLVFGKPTYEDDSKSVYMYSKDIKIEVESCIKDPVGWGAYIEFVDDSNNHEAKAKDSQPIDQKINRTSLTGGIALVMACIATAAVTNYLIHLP